MPRPGTRPLLAMLLLLGGCADRSEAGTPDGAPTTAPTSTTTTAPPPAEWSWAYTRLTGPGHQLVSAVAAAGPGFVAVGIDSSAGDSDGAVWVSADGISWVRIEAPELGGPGGQGINDLAVGPAGIVAVGFDSVEGDIDAATWMSADGFVWEQSDPAVFRREGHQEARAVLDTPGGIVAAGFAVDGREADAAVWTSVDGRSWQEREDPALGGRGTQRISSLTLGPAGIVAGGTNYLPNEFGLYDLDARVWLSPDGTTWTAVDDPNFGGPGWQYINSIVSGPSGLVAAGGDVLGRPGLDNDAAVWVSQDGVAWRRVADEDFEADHAQQISRIALGSDGLVAVGYDTGPSGNRSAAMWVSADGSAWVRTLDPVFTVRGHRWMTGAVLSETGWVVVGTDGETGGGHPAVWVYGAASGIAA